MSIDVGARLKHVRELHGLSQRELARRAGVTNGLISLIEQNRVSPSVGSLKKVLDGVPMSMAEFFTLDVNSAAQVFYSADELVEIGNEAASLRAGRRAAPGSPAHACCTSATSPVPRRAKTCLSHRGEEGGVVVRGTRGAHRGRPDARARRPGDAYYFPAPRRISFRNVGPEVCEIISASTPPTF